MSSLDSLLTKISKKLGKGLSGNVTQGEDHIITPHEKWV